MSNFERLLGQLRFTDPEIAVALEALNRAFTDLRNWQRRAVEVLKKAERVPNGPVLDCLACSSPGLGHTPGCAIAALLKEATS